MPGDIGVARRSRRIPRHRQDLSEQRAPAFYDQSYRRQRKMVCVRFKHLPSPKNYAENLKRTKRARLVSLYGAASFRYYPDNYCSQVGCATVRSKLLPISSMGP